MGIIGMSQQNIQNLERIFYQFPKTKILALLAIPVIFLLIYGVSLLILFLQSFYRLDDFSGAIIADYNLNNYIALGEIANIHIILRSFLMALIVNILAIIIGFPIAWYMVAHAKGRMKFWLFFAVMMPLWSGYLVRVYAWKMILAKEGVLYSILSYFNADWLIDAVLSVPLLGGNSLSLSYFGTIIVFLYLWLPYMILPIEANLSKMAKNIREASQDCGASAGQTMRFIVIPLAIPGIAAGSLFVFALTLGDYITPQIIGPSRLVIGQAVYVFQGNAGNLPLAAAFSVVPLIIMLLYLSVAKKLRAFDD